jgi:CSLREA domain-containing protein
MRATVRGPRAATTFVLLVLLHELLPPVLAFTFTVDTHVDAFDASPGDGVCASAIGSCTLRAAIDEANALGGHHTVVVPSGIHAVTLGQLTILANVTIQGTGTAINSITPHFWSVIDANHLSRVFHVGVGHSVHIKGVTIRNGRAVVYPCRGGGIRNDGILTIDDSVIRDNEAGNFQVCSGVGGGIYNSESGVLTLSRSLVRDNRAESEGSSLANWGGTAAVFESTLDAPAALGPIGFYGIQNTDGSLFTLADSIVQGDTGQIAELNAEPDSLIMIVNSTIRRAKLTGIQNAGVMTMIGSTVSQNPYGGIRNYSPGQLAMENSTISGNGSFGVDNGSSGPAPSLFALNVTITNNESKARNAQGVGIRTQGSALTTLINTIVARNKPGDCRGTQLSLGHNLDGDGSCGLTAAGDLSGVNPVLGPLANNGGPTETHLPLVFSPAIGAGDAGACPTTDQRGMTRPQAGCDIGAVEVSGKPRSLSDLHLHIPEKPDPDTIPPGPDPVAYGLVVMNRAGQGQADDVTLHVRVHGGRVLAARSTRGKCQVVVPNGREASTPTPSTILTCRVGDLPDGHVASVRLEIAPPDDDDSTSLVVVSGVALSEVKDLQPQDNVAAAVTRFRR